MDYSHLMATSLRFGFHPRNWLPFFILNMATALSLLGLLLAAGGPAIVALATAATNPSLLPAVLGALAPFLAVLVIAFLAQILVTAAIAQEAAKKPSPAYAGGSWYAPGSWRAGRSRYPSLLGATVVVQLLTGAVSALPFIGWVFAIVLSTGFFLYIPFAVPGRAGALAALRSSWQRFRQKPGQMFAVWLLTSLIGGLLILLFATPAIFTVGLSVLASGQPTNQLSSFATVLVVLLSNLPALLIASAILFAGASLAAAFTLKAQVEYWKLRK